MSNSPFLSIIIPVYNVEEYISRCLDSLINQDLSYNEYEIIVVNDGTPDNSMDIVDQYQKKYSNIIRQDKQNGGVSSARNVGIHAAKGKYLLFVDSDDTIEKNSLNTIYNELEKRPNQIMILNSIIYENELKIKEAYKFPQELAGKTLTGIELFQNGYLRGSVCGVVFEKNFILDYKLKFSEEIKNEEDSIFMVFSFMYAVSVSYFNLDFYKVNVRKNSASRVWNYSKVKDCLIGLDVLVDFSDIHSLTDEQLSMLTIRAYGIISNSLFYFFTLNHFHLGQYKEIKSIIRRSNLYPLKTYRTELFKYKIKLLNFSVTMFSIPFFFRRVYKSLIKYTFK